MLIVQKPLVSEGPYFHTCDFHKKNPGKSFAGCTCYGGYKAREKKLGEMTPEEIEWYIGAIKGES